MPATELQTGGTDEGKTEKLKRLRIINAINWAIVGVGILLRVVVYLQNRNLIIDEANVARNLHERSFSELAKPLSYEQFAPPIFLFIGKMNMIIFGGYEWALRILPFFCGLFSLIILYMLLRRVSVVKGAFYPLGLMATGIIYLRQGTELKQYSSDVLVALLLILLALKVHPVKIRPLPLFLLWFFSGILAIGFSMPSVFVLAGIGVYYFMECLKTNNKNRLLLVCLIGLTWIALFISDYYFLLKPSIQSSYLQNYHQRNFLYLVPKNGEQLIYNVDSLSTFFSEMGGHWALSVALNLLLLGIGFYSLFKRNRQIFFLVAVPVFSLFVAAGLHQFVLVPRVALFAYPILLFIIGVGLEQCFNFKYRRYTTIPLLICCGIALFNFNSLRWMFQPLKFDWTTENLQWAEARKIPGHQVFIHDTGKAEWIYYTTIHPNKARWAQFKDANVFFWNTNIDSLGSSIKGRSVFIFSSPDLGELNHDLQILRNYQSVQDSIVSEPFRYTFLFSPINKARL